MALFLAPAWGVETPLSDASVNVPTVVSNYFNLEGGAGGALSIKAAKGGRAVQVRLKEVEEATVHRLEGSRFAALMRLKPVSATGPAWAECVVDLAGAGRVERFSLLDAAQVAAYRKTATAAAAGQLSAEKKPLPKQSRPKAASPSSPPSGILLETVGGEEASDPMACEAKKCLLAIVAPWCTFCRRSTAKLLDLKDYLIEFEVETRVVVTRAEQAEIEEYANEFGPEAFLDPGGRVPADSFPQFVVLIKGGKTLGIFNGAPRSDEPAEIAASFGLP